VSSAAQARWAALAPVLLVAITAALYTWGLDRAPVYIGGDEAHFASHAHAIATTGRDLNGTRLPLFVQVTDLLVPNNSTRIWYQPALFYLLAIDLRLLPFDEVSVRLPTALIGVLNVWLMYLVARQLFGRRREALIAATALAMTPAHLLLSRQALDYICPLPVVLTWLWLAIKYEQTRRTALILMMGLLLGVGVFTYISSWAVMPLLALLTAIVLRPPVKATAGAVALMVAPIALVVPWLWSRPHVLADTVGRYRINRGAAAGSALDFNLAERVTLYWDYFNPSFLFFAGGANPTLATSRVGVFLLPIAVFLSAGIVRLCRERTTGGTLALAGFAAAPLPIVLAMPSAPEYSIARAFSMVPFAILIATAGVQQLLDARQRAIRLVGMVLLAAMPLQFAAFLGDYFTDYQLRSAPRFDPIATPEVMAAIDALDRALPAPRIFFNDDLDDKSVRWRFYALKHHRLDLWNRASYFDASRFEPSAVPSGSLLVLSAGDARTERMIATGTTLEVARINGVGGHPAAAILRRR
jgi:4-amino-4-deoxy-L-arabinose transferase-like glycosyltransferase